MPPSASATSPTADGQRIKNTTKKEREGLWRERVSRGMVRSLNRNDKLATSADSDDPKGLPYGLMFASY